MRTRIARAGLLLATLATAPLRATAGDVAEGQAIWSSACARCHRDPEAVVRDLEPEDAAGRAAYLDGFLARHRMPDPAKRATLIAWLLSLTGE